MNNLTIGRSAFTMILLGTTLVGGGTAVAATAGHKSESGGSQTGRGYEPSKAAPKGQEKAGSQSGIGTGPPARPDPTPSNKNQMVEERLRRGDVEDPSPQGQISDRLDQFYQGSNGLSGRQAAGLPDR